MDLEQILNERGASKAMAGILVKVKQLKETSDIAEAAQLLSTGEWIAICATPEAPYLFSLGKVTD